MCGVIDGVARDSSHLEQLSCEVRRILGRAEKRDVLQSIQTVAGGFRVTRTGLRDDKRGSNQSGPAPLSRTFSCWGC